MKTAHVIRRFAFSEWGGTESVVWNTVRNLNNDNTPSEILATTALSPIPRECREGVEIRRFPYLYPYFPLSSEKKRTLDKKGGNPYSLELLDYLKQSEAELFHCHTMGRLAAEVCLAAKYRNVPYVVSFHGGCFDVPDAEMREMLKPTRKTLRYGAVLDRLLGLRIDPLQHADGLLCVGRNELEPTRMRYPDKLVEYLPNGVNVEYFRKRSEYDFRTHQGIPGNRKIMLSVSRIDYQKNQLMLLEALARLTARGENWQLVLIGAPTSKWYYDKVIAGIEQLDLRGRVTIIPGVPPDSPALPAAYQAADVFVLPSIHEPFGIVVLEAWSAGVPVIVAPSGGLNFLVKEDETGLFCNTDDVEKLVRLATLLTSNAGLELKHRLIRNAGNYVEHEYAWPKISARLMEFYQEISRRHAARRN